MTHAALRGLASRLEHVQMLVTGRPVQLRVPCRGHAVRDAVHEALIRGVPKCVAEVHAQLEKSITVSGKVETQLAQDIAALSASRWS